ncbi:peptidoglycan DD-metalloendopeptidase family protein, partial [candidate division KSB1 bacterium]|nr:peptidoglycan DD-metalloendopeptidase family protein [candidate division KSB1 bacterium]
GILNPVILLPESAETWESDRIRVVLLHELSHIKRRDMLYNVMAGIAKTLFWFNPLVWYAHKRLCIERERACDDIVLTNGIRSSDYADLLLEVARSLKTKAKRPFAAAFMAFASQLENRMGSILDKKTNRKTMTPTTAIVTCILAIALVLPFSAMKPAGDIISIQEENDEQNKEVVTTEEVNPLNYLLDIDNPGEEIATLESLEKTKINEESNQSLMSANQLIQSQAIEKTAKAIVNKDTTKERLRYTPSVLPVNTEDGEIHISDQFRTREDPISGAVDFHQGIDIVVNIGTPVNATADGTILELHKSTSGSLGKYVRISHNHLKYGYETRYAHLSKINPDLKVGSIVKRWDNIGEIGNTGRVASPHLHYEVIRWGKFVDPQIKEKTVKVMINDDTVKEISNFRFLMPESPEYYTRSDFSLEGSGFEMDTVNNKMAFAFADMEPKIKRISFVIEPARRFTSITLRLGETFVWGQSPDLIAILYYDDGSTYNASFYSEGGKRFSVTGFDEDTQQDWSMEISNTIQVVFDESEENIYKPQIQSQLLGRTVKVKIDNETTKEISNFQLLIPLGLSGNSIDENSLYVSGLIFEKVGNFVAITFVNEINEVKKIVVTKSKISEKIPPRAAESNRTSAWSIYSYYGNGMGVGFTIYTEESKNILIAGFDEKTRQNWSSEFLNIVEVVFDESEFAPIQDYPAAASVFNQIQQNDAKVYLKDGSIKDIIGFQLQPPGQIDPITGITGSNNDSISAGYAYAFYGYNYQQISLIKIADPFIQIDSLFARYAEHFAGSYDKIAKIEIIDSNSSYKGMTINFLSSKYNEESIVDLKIHHENGVDYYNHSIVSLEGKIIRVGGIDKETQNEWSADLADIKEIVFIYSKNDIDDQLSKYQEVGGQDNMPVSFLTKTVTTQTQDEIAKVSLKNGSTKNIADIRLIMPGGKSIDIATAGFAVDSFANLFADPSGDSKFRYSTAWSSSSNIIFAYNSPGDSTYNILSRWNLTPLSRGQFIYVSRYGTPDFVSMSIFNARDDAWRSSSYPSLYIYLYDKDGYEYGHEFINQSGQELTVTGFDTDENKEWSVSFEEVSEIVISGTAKENSTATSTVWISSPGQIIEKWQATQTPVEKTGTIDGFITLMRTGSPIWGVNVSINSDGYKTITNNDGYFKLNNVPPGVYDLAASLESFKPAKFENLVVREDETTTLSFAMVSTFPPGIMEEEIPYYLPLYTTELSMLSPEVRMEWPQNKIVKVTFTDSSVKQLTEFRIIMPDNSGFTTMISSFYIREKSLTTDTIFPKLELFGIRGRYTDSEGNTFDMRFIGDNTGIIITGIDLDTQNQFSAPLFDILSVEVVKK